jgi:hypothetical protein
MVRMRALVWTVPLLLACSGAAALGGDLSLEMKNGRVTLVAENVTLRQILAEWARVGQTRIVNGDRVSGGPLSLRLVDVPEGRALDTILRGVAGYMAAPRAADVASMSVYDRILILPTSSAPAAAASAPPQRQPPPAFPQPPAPVEPVEEDSGDDSPQPTPFAPFNPPRPQEFEQGNSPFRRAPGMGGPPVNQVPVPGGMAPVQTPAQPFFGTTGRPGEIVQPPATQVPGAPGVVPGVARPGQVVPPPVPQPPQ